MEVETSKYYTRCIRIVIFICRWKQMYARLCNMVTCKYVVLLGMLCGIVQLACYLLVIYQECTRLKRAVKSESRKVGYVHSFRT